MGRPMMPRPTNPTVAIVRLRLANLQRFRSCRVPKPFTPSGFFLKKNPPRTTAGNGYMNCETALRWDCAQLLQLFYRDRGALSAAARSDSAAFDAGLGADRDVARGRNPLGG